MKAKQPYAFTVAALQKGVKIVRLIAPGDTEHNTQNTGKDQTLYKTSKSSAQAQQKINHMIQLLIHNYMHATYIDDPA